MRNRVFTAAAIYLRMHRDELDDCRLMINVDVAGSIMGHNFVRVSGEESVANFIRFLADEVGTIRDIKRGLMGSDSTPLQRKAYPPWASDAGKRSACSSHIQGSIRRSIAARRRLRIRPRSWSCLPPRDEREVLPIPQTIPENIVKRVNDMMSGYGRDG